jgi:ribulose-5-phosphate 4-epimerase/fuculose-1-phosphate aldolase
MKIGFASDYESPFMTRLVDDLREELAARGHDVHPAGPPESLPADLKLVFNLTRADAPRANYARSSASQFVCTLAETSTPSSALQKEAYAVLVKTMSNLLAYAVHREDRPATYLVTPELGFREAPHGPDHVRMIADQVLGISDVRFMIENDLVEDLPAELREGDERTQAIARTGVRLDGLGLLPSVLPLEQILSERERRLLMKVFGVKQLSYGNLSCRRDRDSFWMSGRGVDKSNLSVIGKDILLVRGADEERGSIRLSVPPGTDSTSRVSVDAIEHFLVYRDFPDVGAIVHVHAWVPGIESTLQNYPCGSLELAQEVLTLVRRSPDPANAIVGLKNHGITATGPDLDTLFDRIAPRLERNVPMD